MGIGPSVPSIHSGSLATVPWRNGLYQHYAFYFDKQISLQSIHQPLSIPEAVRNDQFFSAACESTRDVFSLFFVFVIGARTFREICVSFPQKFRKTGEINNKTF